MSREHTDSVPPDRQTATPPAGWRRALRLFRADPAAEVDQEIAFHLAMRELDAQASGAGPAEAREQARARFGDLETIRSECVQLARRAERRRAFGAQLGALRDDTVAAGVGLWRRPAFALSAITTLALGLGAAIGLFALLDRLLLRPLPFPQPEQLHTIEATADFGGGATKLDWSYPKFLALRDGLSGFTGVAGWSRMAFNLAAPQAEDQEFAGVDADPQRVDVELVTVNYFRVLGLQLTRGRGFASSDDQPDGSVVVLSDTLWRQRFAARSDIFGQPLLLQDITLTVVGVAPPGFRGLSGHADLWVPTALAPLLVSPRRLEQAQAHWLTVFGRSAPEVDSRRVGELVAAAGSLVQALFPTPGGGAVTTPLAAAGRSPQTTRALLLLQLASLLLLAIVAANLGSLLLARGYARRQELAIRVAIGAERWRLLRQVWLEAVLLGLSGSLLGLLLAELAWRTFIASPGAAKLPLRSALARLPGALEPLLGDPRLLLFAVVSALLTALLATLGPTLRLLSDNPKSWLLSTRQPAGLGTSRQPVRAALVIVETALALVLVFGAGLLAASLVHQQRIEIGVDEQQVLTAELNLPRNRYAPEQVRLLYAELTRRVDALPGVTASSISSCLPLSGGCDVTQVTLSDQSGQGEASEPPAAGAHLVTPGHLTALGIDLIAGRPFANTDRSGSAKVALVDEAAARQFWPGKEPLGRQLDLGIGWPPEGELATVVGVVANVRYSNPQAAPTPNVYVPALQHAYSSAWLVVRAAVPPASLAAPLRQVLRELDPTLPLADLRPLADRLADATGPARWSARIVASFASVAAALAALGLYGLLGFEVAQRLPELGVRQALGASRANLIVLVVRQGLTLVTIGLGVGMLVSLALARLLPGLLYEVSPADPKLISLAVVSLLAAASLALVLPAWRASRVDAANCLRQS